MSSTMEFYYAMTLKFHLIFKKVSDIYFLIKFKELLFIFLLLNYEKYLDSVLITEAKAMPSF